MPVKVGAEFSTAIKTRILRSAAMLPPLTEEQIVAWADAHHAATGKWPSAASGPVAAAPGETWGAINVGLGYGSRGLPGGSTLHKLLLTYGRK